jgi:hypothetical protein
MYTNTFPKIKNLQYKYSDNFNARHHFEDLCRGGRMILKLILKKQGLKIWNGFIWPRIWTNGKLNNELSEYKKGGK